MAENKMADDVAIPRKVVEGMMKHRFSGTQTAIILALQHKPYGQHPSGYLAGLCDWAGFLFRIADREAGKLIQRNVILSEPDPKRQGWSLHRLNSDVSAWRRRRRWTRRPKQQFLPMLRYEAKHVN